MDARSPIHVVPGRPHADGQARDGDAVRSDRRRLAIWPRIEPGGTRTLASIGPALLVAAASLAFGGSTMSKLEDAGGADPAPSSTTGSEVSEIVPPIDRFDPPPVAAPPEAPPAPPAASPPAPAPVDEREAPPMPRDSGSSLPSVPQASTPSPAPIQLAQAMTEPRRQSEDLSGSSPRSVRSVTRAVSDSIEGPRDSVLVAALAELPPPSYSAPASEESVGWMRQFGAVRSAGRQSAYPETGAPSDHTGLSFSSSPRLWWRLSEPTDDAIQVTVVDEEAIEPLLRVELPGPHAAGPASIDLARHGLRLEPGVEYRWYVGLLVDRDRPSRNPISAGAIRVVAEADSRRREVADAPAPMRGHTLAKLGIWYDAYDFFAELSRTHPDSGHLARSRDRLMDGARGR